ncbi:hypothetical protein Vretimale_19263 [Volvox reticuliferus]|uniref:FAM91 C-terminal domain-containing protein n=2 Tax=Volvox reticuliferus TaxID=1737510 RepID=A0A8J4GYP0_9CHLO|nr:hypothetical protein Vretimale_19263 [Volvox reticuliferus]
MPPSPGMPTSGTLEGEASSVGIGSGELYGRGSVGVVGDGGGDEAALQQQQQQRSLQLAEGLLGPAGRELRGTISGAVGGGGGVAVVVDAEATGYLMMGALSPGLKRHSVTLFEGGRVAGEEVMQEMVSELWSSYAAGQGFEGEMLRLTHYAAALATLLEAVRASAGPGVPLELLRKESLAGLSPMAVSKVLNHAYCAVVPISPLPPPVLPLSPLQPGPAYYGPTLEAVSPWLHLALYSAARCGPASYVFVCGQRVWRLPHPLDRCTHALLTPWDEDTEPGKSGRSHGTEGQMMLVESSFLLYTLNELLSRTAVLVQPLDCTEPEWCPDVVDVPLPLPAAESTAASASAAAAAASDRLTLHRISSTEPSSASTIASPSVVPGIRRTNGEPVKVVLEPGLVSGLRQLGLASCIGHLRLIRMRTPPPRPAAVAEQQLHPPASPAGTVGGSSVGGPHGVTVNGSRDGGGALQGQLLQWQGDGFPAADAGGGSGAMRTSGSITITAASQSRNRDAAVAAAATQGPGGPNASGPQPLVDSSGLPTPVPSPRPPAAPGGGGGVCGLDFDAAGAAVAVDDRGGDPWLPLSVQLGVPLYCLNLCRAVCRAAQAAGFLTPEGRQTQLQAHKVLQTQLTKLLVQYSHCAQDGSYGSATGLVAAAAAAVGEAAALSPDIRAALMASGGGGGGVDLGVGGGGCAGDSSSSIGSGGILGRMNPVLPLPALNLSFDGHSLQPIRLRDSVQGLGCLCQG